jgi:replicative DNA helicase
MSSDFEKYKESIDLSDIDLDELCAEKEIRLEDQDLRLLKGILSSERSGRDFADRYGADLFVGDARRFAKEVLSYIKLFRAPPTKRVLLDKFKDDSEFCSDIEHIWNKIDGTEYDIIEFNYDLEKIKDRFTESKIISIKDALGDSIIDSAVDYEETLRRAKIEMEQLERLRSGKRQTYIQKSLKDYIPEFREEYYRKVQDETFDRGVLTGYSYIDYVTGGLCDAEMLIIGGESSSGKSMLLNNMAIQMWMQQNTIFTDPNNLTPGCDILYFSLEMPYKACARRTLARLSGLPSYGIRDAKIGSDKIDFLKKAATFVARYPSSFEIVDIPRGTTVEQIEERYLESVSSGNDPKVIVVDYLGLMEAIDASGEDWLNLGYISGKLHELGRVYNVIVLTAVQLNRPPNKANAESSELIGMHRIGRSFLIVQHANVVLQIESRKGENTYADLITHIIKNRDGQLGRCSMIKDFPCASIRDMDPPYVPTGDSSFDASGQDLEDISNMLDEIKWLENSDG